MGLLSFLSGGLSLIPNILNNISANKMANKQNKWNKEAADLAYQRDMAMYDKQNAYNTPAAQLQRYQDAGLNPMLMYGGGSSPGNATSYPQSPVMKYNVPTFDFSGLMDGLRQMQALKLNDIQSENMKADIDLKRQNVSKSKEETTLAYSKQLTEQMRALLYANQTGGVMLSNRLKGDLFNYQVDLFKTQLATAKSVLQQRKNELSLFPYVEKNAGFKNQMLENAIRMYKPTRDNLDIRNSLLKQQYDLKNGLYNNKMTEKDPLIFRLLMRMIEGDDSSSAGNW